ncbi:MAG: isoprenylcysteine carboxylmethyltransferase family protein [Cytophagales bacterium]|nr:isoprenylcysteine carboxylmethyltransferase family protein [Cytophagales bacterium]
MYLFIFFILYFFLVFALRSFLLWKKTKVNPLTFNKEDDAHGYNGKVFGFVFILELIIVSIYAFFPQWHKFLLPFWYFEIDSLMNSGWLLLIISLFFVWFAQGNMRESWRIGIDEENKSELITDGFFSLSRNPIFLGIMIANTGLFLVLPNAFTLLIVALSTVSINTQIRLEEEFLFKEFGSQYAQYQAKVNRWFTIKL